MQKRRHILANCFVVIMAGGSGKRLWPESRAGHPKQFQCLVDPARTLLQETYDRVRDLVDRSHIFVSTTAAYVEIVHGQLPEILADNIIIEPCGRDTAPALAFVADHIYRIDPEAILLTVPSDHTIKEVGVFAEVVRTMFTVVDAYPERIGLMGIKTTEASTAFGYIMTGDEYKKRFAQTVLHVDAFVEKPSAKLAEKYFRDWQYLWNSGCFVFLAATLLERIEQHVPEIAHILEQMHACQNVQIAERLFATMPCIPIDKAVMEKLSKHECFVVPARLTWSDVGNWRSLHDFLCNGDPCKNYFRGDVIAIDTHNCLIYETNDTVIATLGLTDVIVVHADGVLLVASRNNVEDVKQIVAQLKDAGHANLL